MDLALAHTMLIIASASTALLLALKAGIFNQQGNRINQATVCVVLRHVNDGYE